MRNGLSAPIGGYKSPYKNTKKRFNLQSADCGALCRQCAACDALTSNDCILSEMINKFASRWLLRAASQRHRNGARVEILFKKYK